CDKYRITLLSNRKEVKPFLPGKRGDEERFYTKRDIQNMIPYLRLKNNEGYGISITPMDDNAYYVLLDDAKISPERINEIGLEPCLIQKTSPNSVQAVFKLPRNLDRQDVIKVFNRLNRTAGDPKMTGLRHPFRLAGFKNTKEKHLQPDGKRPFVTVEFTSNRFSQTLARQCSVAPIHEEVQNELYETLEAAVAAESRNNKMRGPS
ncbi:DNA-primase RepB domain-containing protein, partial [Lactobacillus amylolyticus]|uniref:DNA-primase RepB domain-containing protein n=1 Tax=Lactobacillus amylolyticus TaxID=83683 RepID=UPI0024938A97